MTIYTPLDTLSSKMHKNLLHLLEQSGFTEKESRVYLALLELGHGDVTKIGKIANLKRSIIYVILEGLIKRGYVSNVPDKKINTYQATDPVVILNRLKSLTKDFSEMLPIFKTLRNVEGVRPKITYLDNRAAIFHIYEEMNYADAPIFITSYSRIEEHYPKAIDYWIKNKNRGLYKLKARHLLPNNPHEMIFGKKLSHADQNVRYLNDLNESNMDFTLFGNKLSISSLGADPFAVLIESQELVNSIKPIFEIAWRSGKESGKKQPH